MIVPGPSHIPLQNSGESVSPGFILLLFVYFLAVMASRTTGWHLLKRVSLLQLVTEAALPVAKKANKRKGLLDPLGLY